MRRQCNGTGGPQPVRWASGGLARAYIPQVPFEGRAVRPKTRMKEVADRAGVSTSTVSRAFSAPHLISDAVRLRVERAVSELGYTINIAARNLRRNDTGVVRLVPDIGNPFFSQLLKGIEQQGRDVAGRSDRGRRA